jgi:peptide/nickel transport system substrate-binding protein
VSKEEKRMHRLWAFLVVCSLMLAACAPAVAPTGGASEQPAAEAGAPVQGGTLMIGNIEDPNSLDPHATIMATASGIMTWIYDRLFYMGDDGLPHGRLAESWEVSEDSLVLTVKLREGRTFTNGEPVNADAVAFTFNRLLNPETAAPAAEQAGTLTTVTALDEYTVEFVFEEPYAPFFFAASGAYMGILPPGAVEEMGDDFGRNPIGSGPFMFSEWVPGQQITLVRNPDYVNVREDRENTGAPYLDSLVFKTIPELGTRIAAMETGEINVMGLTRESVPQFENNPAFKIIQATETASLNFVEFNYTRPPFDNPDFRRAFGLAIDKEAIALGAYGGFGTLNYNPYPNGNPGYDPAIGEEYGMHYDPEAAAALFEEIGWVLEGEQRVARGVEGIEDGTPAHFTCWTYPTEIKQRECEIIQSNLGDVGITIEIQLTDFGTMSAEMPNGDFDFDVMRWTWNEPVILSLLFKCPGWVQLFCDEELDTMLIDAETEMDAVARLEKVAAIQQYLLEQAVIIPLVSDWYILASAANIQGLEYDSTFGWTLEDVWVAQE